MFKLCWDKENNGIILSDAIPENEQIQPVRPVFYEELDLLGFNVKFDYPRNELPILWAIDRRYYYKGELVAEARGGSLYKDPRIEFAKECSFKFFDSIPIEKVLQKNIKSIYALENEAMDFVKDTYTKYGKKVDGFVVAFSGGKDSQVILDIVSRVIPPNDYKVVFTDTDMEIPFTYETVKYTEKFYTEKYEGLEFVAAKSNKKALDLWESYGPPSRINRWCCSVLKTALFGRKMKELLSTERQPKLVVFEGVRSEESNKRDTYNRIGEGVKHINLINSRAIFRWNLTEIYLYMFYRNIKINQAYRYGLTRVGCSVCPFASDWSEFIIRKLYPDLAKKYVQVIEKMAKNIGINSKHKIDDYIDSGNWKKNAGGKGLNNDDSRVDVITKEPNFEAVITNPKVDIFNWLCVVGDYIIKQSSDNKYLGEIKHSNEVYKFDIEKIKEKLVIKIYNTTNKVLFTSALYKIVNKAAFCEGCGVCEVECPTGALRVYPRLDIDTSLCTKCKNCLNINSKGCIIADRKAVSEGETKLSVKSSGIDKYSTFGLREMWLANFFDEMDNWFINNGGLGVRQIPAMINWLREAELLEIKEKKTTNLAQILKQEFYKEPLLVWQIVWINLYFNSTIVKWYVEDVKNNISYTKPELHAMLKEAFPSFSDGTLGNPLDAIINTFNESPLGSGLELGVTERKGNATKSVTKVGGDFISPIAICYFLYKLSETKGIYEWTVSDFYEKGETGPFQLFGVSVDYFLNCLRALQEYGVIKADLLGGLDNIHINEDSNSLEVLKLLMQR